MTRQSRNATGSVGSSPTALEFTLPLNPYIYHQGRTWNKRRVTLHLDSA
jgi:hypothetical protein